MTSSRSGWFNSVRSNRYCGAVAEGKTRPTTRSLIWLIVLIAGGYCSAFAQHGVQEFTANGTFMVPTGVSVLRVDAYGGGGGAGGDDSTFVGGGGGGGAYAAGVITVSPGAALTIVIGSGGKAGSAGNPAGAGSPGGASKILDPSKLLIFSANGGKGGQGASGGANGVGGAGGGTGTFGSIRHAGQNGDSFGNGGFGYVPVGYTLTFNQGPKFGNGGGASSENGLGGQPGYILISW